MQSDPLDRDVLLERARKRRPDIYSSDTPGLRVQFRDLALAELISGTPSVLAPQLLDPHTVLLPRFRAPSYLDTDLFVQSSTYRIDEYVIVIRTLFNLPSERGSRYDYLVLDTAVFPPQDDAPLTLVDRDHEYVLAIETMLVLATAYDLPPDEPILGPA